jgi:hypothetical protein
VTKKLFAMAALVLATTGAQAQYTFEYGGRTFRVDPDRGTVSIPGVYDNSVRRAKRSRNDQDSDRPRKNAPQQAKVDPQAPAAPVQTDQAPAPNAPDSSSTKATLAPTDSPSAAQPQPNAPPVRQAPRVPPLQPNPNLHPWSPLLRWRRQCRNSRPLPPQSAATPLDLSLTEEKEGKVHIEQCGANLCGYSVDAKSNQNGEQILINMKPGNDSRWSGRILDPNTGSTYDSTIALKGSDNLWVQGCAFGGMFCGGQTWSRAN